MTEALPTLLEYAPPVPRVRPIRRVLRWMIFVLTAITVMIVVSHAVEDQIVKWQHRQAVNAMLRVQNDCLRYTIAANTLVFNPASGVAFHPALYDQFVQSLGPSFDRESLGFDIGGGILFMHEVDSPDGQRALMIVNLHTPVPGGQAYMLRCYHVQLGSADKPSQIEHVSCPLTIHVMPLTSVRAFAGQAVAGQASQFVLPLSINNRRVTIDCSLRNDQTVRFTASDGMLVESNQPREGAMLFFDRLPLPDDLLHTKYSLAEPPIRNLGVRVLAR